MLDISFGFLKFRIGVLTIRVGVNWKFGSQYVTYAQYSGSDLVIHFCLSGLIGIVIGTLMK
jgi:hypothetical protein